MRDIKVCVKQRHIEFLNIPPNKLEFKAIRTVGFRVTSQTAPLSKNSVLSIIKYQKSVLEASFGKKCLNNGLI